MPPPPPEVRALVAASYAGPRAPLVVSFDDDGIDESDVLEVRGAARVMSLEPQLSVGRARG